MGASTSTYNTNEDQIMLRPLTHLNKVPKIKNYQMEIWLSFNHWFKLTKAELKEISELENDLATTILVIDDIIDKSKLRNGIGTAHLVYGTPLTIYSSIYGIAKIFDKLVFKNPKVIDYFIKAGLNMYRGQAMEIYFTENVICPTIEEYNEIVSEKTLAPFLFSLQLMQTFAKKHKTTNFEAFTKKLGLFYQICNDYICLKSKPYASVKIFGEDITTGRFSYPIIHAVQRSDEITDILKQRTSDPDVKHRFVDLLEELGSLDFTLQMLNKLKKECIEEMNKIEENPQLEEILNSTLKHIENIVMR